LPRFSGDYWKNNQNLAKAFADLAADKGCTPAQLSLAWVLARGDHIIPIPGTKHRKYLEENAGATDILLTISDLENIDHLLSRFPNVGPRYSERHAKQVDKD
jgi:aryl-alcohol dehydrogenase-like predicted oxidoreductase